MEPVTRYAIQCYDPTEPHFWFILPQHYKSEEEAQDKIHILDKVEASHRIPNLRILKQRVLPFTIEVPV